MPSTLKNVIINMGHDAGAVTQHVNNCGIVITEMTDLVLQHNIQLQQQVDDLTFRLDCVEKQLDIQVKGEDY